MAVPDTFEHLELPDRDEWRAWLAEHFETAPGIWLVYAKKNSGLTSVSYSDAVEEALCFGWIDSKVRSIDDDRYRQLYTPRRPGSVWSRPNKERVERVIAAGLMTDTGIARIEAAKADGSWHMLDEIDELIVPDDLAEALAGQAGATEAFEKFTPSQKKPLLYWIASAKRQATREQRIAETVRRAVTNDPFGEAS